MSGFLVFLVIVAGLLVAFGLQVLSGQIRRFPVDLRPADPLIDITTTKSTNVRPAELHHLILIVSNSLQSDASARNELQPILDDLGATGPATGKTNSSSLGRRSRGRGRRSSQIAEAIDELEQQWGIGSETGGSP